MLTKDLKDLICPDKRMEVAASSEAMNQFVKFLYGFELEDDLSQEIVKELVQIGGVYDEHLQKAGTELLKRHLTKEMCFRCSSCVNKPKWMLGRRFAKHS